jgi:hypothetical protein
LNERQVHKTIAIDFDASGLPDKLRDIAPFSIEGLLKELLLPLARSKIITLRLSLPDQAEIPLGSTSRSRRIQLSYRCICCLRSASTTLLQAP